jgi:hypothetical protein
VEKALAGRPAAPPQFLGEEQLPAAAPQSGLNSFREN